MISFYEFINIYLENEPVMSIFRNRYIRVLPFIFRRNARLIGSVFMTKTNLFLIIGLITAKPQHILPWLTIKAITLLLEVFLWIIDLVSGDIKLHFSSVISLASFGTLWLLVNCIKEVFENAIEINDTDEITLIKAI